MQTNSWGVCQFGQILKCVVDQDSRKVGCLQVMWQVSVRILASRLIVKKKQKKKTSHFWLAHLTQRSCHCSPRTGSLTDKCCAAVWLNPWLAACLFRKRVTEWYVCPMYGIRIAEGSRSLVPPLLGVLASVRSVQLQVRTCSPSIIYSVPWCATDCFI